MAYVTQQSFCCNKKATYICVLFNYAIMVASLMEKRECVEKRECMEMLNLIDTSSPTWRIVLVDQIRLMFARRKTISVCFEPRTHEPCSFAKFIVILRYALPTTIVLSRDFLVLPPCRTHISSLLHDPTYLYFLTVLHAHLPLRKRTIRETVRSNFIC